MSIPDHLITPLDWSAEALRHAAEWTGQPEGTRALVESRRYLAMHELIERLRDAQRTQHDADSRELRRLCAERDAARRERDELKADQAESDAVRERLADLLSRTAIAIRGPEPELTRWSWHDVPDRVAAAIAALGGAVQAAAEAMRERDELKNEVARLRDGLQLIACEPINAESMASNVLNGLPAYHDTTLAPAAAPERADPAAPTCETNGLLGATSGVGRECDYWAGGVCTSPHPCQHQQWAGR